MPTVALEIPETYDSVTRPVTSGIVRDLINYFELPNDTSIRYMGSAGEVAQRGSQLADERSNLHFPFGERVDVELTETYLEEGVLNTAVKRRDNNPVFLDEGLMVAMRPVYTKTEATISFRYRATNKTQAYKWRDALRRRMTQGTQALLHELIYHYPIPPVFHAILREVHGKRESVAGYGESFTQWLEKHYDPRMTVLSNLDGSRGAVAIPEKQIQVQGWLSFESEPDEPEKDREGDTWLLSFDYTFQYDKVTAMVIDYPIVVHNQLLDDKYLDLEKPYNPYDVPRRPSYTGRLNDSFSRINYNPDTAFQGVVMPDFDDWRPSGNNFKEIPIVTSLIGVELDDPYQVVNLMDLGDVSLTQSVINYLFRERRYLGTYLASPFHVTFYRGKTALSANSFYIDEDLNVRTREPLSPRDVHHVRLSIVTDLRNLSSRAQESLRRDPEVCFQVVDVLDGLQRPWLPMADSVGVQTKAEIIDRKGQWNSIYPSRPGFHLPSGDWSHIRPKDSNPHRPTKIFKEWEEAQREGRGWQPVEELLKRQRQSPTFEALTEWLNVGALVVLSGGVMEGKEILIVFFNGKLYQLTVNHFLKASIVGQNELEEEGFYSFWVDDNYYLVNSSSDVVAYIETQLRDKSIYEVLTLPEVKKALSPDTNVTIINHYGIYKPTYQNSKPTRLVSPTRPNLRGPMLSDELRILGNKVVTKPSFELVITHLKTEVSLASVSQGQGMRTVMQAGIVVHQ